MIRYVRRGATIFEIKDGEEKLIETYNFTINGVSRAKRSILEYHRMQLKQSKEQKKKR